jgi:SNF2 family DNA or RNA helicase
MFKTKPYKYQKERILSSIDILKEHGFSAFLMEMGTGKTLCSLYTGLKLLKDHDLEGIVVIPPKALFTTWEKEIQKHIDLNMHIVFWESKKAKNKSFQKSISSFFVTNDFPILIANVELFQTKQESFFSFLTSLFDNKKILVIVDESGYIKNAKANRTKRLIKYTRNAAYRAILTGTEISNSVLDLFSQFEFLKTNFWGIDKKTLSQRYYVFRARYMILKEMEVNRRIFQIPVAIKPGKLEELSRIIAPYTIRARKKDCLDIPDKIYNEILLDPNKEQLKIYKELKDFMMTEYKGQELAVTTKIALYTRFRQIAGGFFPETGQLIGTSNVKLDYILADSAEYKGKILIWCAFRPEVEHLHNIIGDSSIILYGGQSKDDRDLILDDFENNNNTKYLLLTAKAGSHGLNLQFASLAYYYTNDLSPDKRFQSEDRIHRNGQSNHPVYKDLVMKNTVEGKILKNLKNKQNMAETFKNMSTEDFIRSV